MCTYMSPYLGETSSKCRCSWKKTGVGRLRQLARYSHLGVPISRRLSSDWRHISLWKSDAGSFDWALSGRYQQNTSTSQELRFSLEDTSHAAGCSGS